jgi:PadR family transcriptional regulator, regulatory protein PadR
MDRERLKGNLDLLLSVLSAGPAHGYAIISALRDRSAGTFDLPEGTIYPALHRLEDSGLLVSTWVQVGGRRRRVYGLTDEGVAALAAKQNDWKVVRPKAGAGEAAVEEARPVLHLFEPGLDQHAELAEVALGQVGQGPLDVRPDALSLGYSAAERVRHAVPARRLAHNQ